VRRKATVFWLLGWTLLFASEGWAGEPVLSVYFPDYRYVKGAEPAFYGTTQLVLFSAKPREDGSVDFSRITPGLLEVGEKAKAQGITAMVCVGGWGRGKEFATAVSTQGGRAHFVEALAGFCAEHSLGGVDIDWEFPKGEQEHADFTKFLGALSKRLRAEGRILTAALGYTRPLSVECYAYLDQVNLMSYQPWSPQDYEGWLREAVARFLDSGLAPEKLVLGVGFFAKEKGGERRAVSYKKMTGREGADLPKSEHGWWPAGKEACDLRVKLVEEFGLGGVMVWDYGHDAVAPEESLLRYLSETLDRG
jgi:GH18 family chitinase